FAKSLNHFSSIHRLNMSSTALAKLERLSLVSKISAEVQNHVGVNDKSVAEYLLA
ncbi:hypothetical protein HDU93_000433, partial [Gonapodya sp. JEL0774]